MKLNFLSSDYRFTDTEGNVIRVEFSILPEIKQGLNHKASIFKNGSFQQSFNFRSGLNKTTAIHLINKTFEK